MLIFILALSFFLFPDPIKGEYCPPMGSNSINQTTNDYLVNYLKSLYPFHFQLFNWPKSVVSSPTKTRLDTKSLTLEELKYYNYISSSMYCTETLDNNLTCCTCGYFNKSVSNYTIIRNDVWGNKVLLTYHASRGEIIVGIRGSTSFQNWVLDFDVPPKNVGRGIKIHTGVYLSVMSVYYQIVYQILEWQKLYRQNEIPRITVTGHSLGGAMAQIMVFFFKYLDQYPYKDIRLVTYGAMRSGNKEFADYMNNLTITTARVVNNRDIVPHSVPVVGFAGPLTRMHYYHIIGEVLIEDDNKIRHCATNKYEDPTCSNRFDPNYSLIDHTEYLGVDVIYCYLIQGNILDLFTNQITGPPSNLIMPAIPRKVTDLSGKMYEKFRNLWCTHNDFPDDLRENSHGTATLSVMVGKGVGVAPGAKWVSCSYCGGSGCGCIDAGQILICANFMVCPNPKDNCSFKPHVVSNSWGYGDSYLDFFKGMTQIWEQTGIIAVKSAGNTVELAYTNMDFAAYSLLLQTGVVKAVPPYNNMVVLKRYFIPE